MSVMLKDKKPYQVSNNPICAKILCWNPTTGAGFIVVGSRKIMIYRDRMPGARSPKKNMEGTWIKFRENHVRTRAGFEGAKAVNMHKLTSFEFVTNKKEIENLDATARPPRMSPNAPL